MTSAESATAVPTRLATPPTQSGAPEGHGRSLVTRGWISTRVTSERRDSPLPLAPVPGFRTLALRHQVGRRAPPQELLRRAPFGVTHISRARLTVPRVPGGPGQKQRGWRRARLGSL